MDDFSNPQQPNFGQSPYASPGQAGSPNYGPGAPPELQSTAPRTFGILNIVFGCILLLGGLCCGGYTMSLSAAGPAMARQQQQMRQQLRQKGQPAPPMPNFNKMNMFQDRRVTIYSVVDLVSGIVLNLIMIISGVGLLSYKEWARKTAVGLAGVKVLRLIALETYCIFVVAPVVANGMADMLTDMMKQMQQQGMPAGPVPQAAELARVYSIMIIAYSAVMLILGIIYPLIMFFVLRRPAAKSSCASRSPQPEYTF